MPTVSVLICVYNGEAYLAEAIDSIFLDGYQDFEILAVDDGSTDSTPAILQSYVGDKRMRVLRKPNGGLNDALNYGIGHAQGKYIARLDADDVTYPGRFAKQVQFLEEHPRCALVGTNCHILNARGKQITKSKLGTLNHAACVERLEKARAFFPHSSWMVRSSAMAELGGYHRFFIRCEDLDFLLRCTERYELACLPDYFVGLRKLPTSLSYESAFSHFGHGVVAILGYLGRRGLVPEVNRYSNGELLEFVRTWFTTNKMSRTMNAGYHVTFARYHFLSGNVVAGIADLISAAKEDPLYLHRRRKLNSVVQEISQRLQAAGAP